MLKNDDLPRLLNSQDVPALSPHDPQPVFAPEGDFNLDGSSDVAISGIYALRSGGKRYFLLVTTLEERGRFKNLFYEEYDVPVFLHERGATGPADPNDQAFSMTFCANCSQGVDFYWDKKAKRFRQEPWKEKEERLQKTVIEPAKDVPPELADQALQVAGRLPDVVAYVEGLKKAGKAFGVRVEYIDETNAAAPLRVKIYEKAGEKEKIYDEIDVDLKTMGVVKRRRGEKGTGK